MPVRGVRRRYLYVKITSDGVFTEDEFNQVLVDKIQFLYGVTGASEMNMRLIEWSDENQAAIVRVHHVMLSEVRATLAHINEISGVVVRLDVVRVSGTIKALKSKI